MTGTLLAAALVLASFAPNAVQLRSGDGRTCLATPISRFAAITAAHCIEGARPAGITLERDGTARAVDTYQAASGNLDLGIVHVQAPLPIEWRITEVAAAPSAPWRFAVRSKRPILGGQSGTPILDSAGRLVAVLTHARTINPRTGYATNAARYRTWIQSALRRDE